MDELIKYITDLTERLPSPEDVKANNTNVTARDWASFFAAVTALMQKLLPLLIPLFVATKDE